MENKYDDRSLLGKKVQIGIESIEGMDFFQNHSKNKILTRFSRNFITKFRFESTIRIPFTYDLHPKTEEESTYLRMKRYLQIVKYSSSFIHYQF
jgi:hypothetical protein